MEDLVESAEEALENKKGRQNIKFVLRKQVTSGIPKEFIHVKNVHRQFWKLVAGEITEEFIQERSHILVKNVNRDFSKFVA